MSQTSSIHNQPVDEHPPDQHIATDALPIQTHMRPEQFAIIGIGTSAGGLEALKTFFDYVPPDFPHTFVIVQHLSPDYKSLMAELLAKNTRMPIYEASNEMVVRPGHVYLIPPGKNMTLHQGRLRIIDKPGGTILNLPINIFFESLAAERTESAVGIILSGTGSDGARGLHAIKDAGGMIMVQSPGTAAFDGMPNSAIATGLVDYVLPVAQMPDELIRYLSAPGDHLAEAALSDEEQLIFAQILRLLQQHTDLDFRLYKRPTLLRRLRRRLTVNNCDTLAEYLVFLQTNPQEAFVLYREFLIGVTRFFRDPPAWALLEQDIIPQIIQSKAPNQPIKAWVVACSSGEEAYTLAILLHEALARSNRLLEIKIFATDIEKEHLDRGAAGIYPDSIAADLTPTRLQRHFTRVGNRYQISPDLRRMIIFSQHNVLSDPPFGKMDLVLCRNLLIYLQTEMQRRLLDTLHYALALNGTLMLGPSETLGELMSSFKDINRQWRIYQNIQARNTINHLTTLPDPYRSITSGQRQQRTRIETRLAEELNNVLLEDMDAACVYIDDTFNILHAVGYYKKYLELPEERFSFNLLKMIPEHMTLMLTAAVRKALHLHEHVQVEDVRLTLVDGTTQYLNLLVVPISVPMGTSDCFMIIFRPQPSTNPQRLLHNPVDTLAVTNDRQLSDMLEQELKEARANLQAALEEAQTSNEELQATNEELMAANEELQSTNEELQSVNEELHTVNAEYQLKIEELAALNADMDNLLNSTKIGTIFLDTNLRIRKFTPAIESEFNLIESDLGRPLAHLATNFHPEDVRILNEHITQVLQTGQPVEREIQTTDARVFLKRIYPFINVRQEVGGVVLTFVDLNEQKKSERLALAMKSHFQAIFNASPDVIMVLDPDGRIVMINRMEPGYRMENVVGTRIYDWFVDQEELTQAREAIQRVFHEGTEEVYYLSTVSPLGEKMCHQIRVSPIRSGSRIEQAAAVARNIQPIRESQEQLQQTLAELSRTNKALEQFAYAASHDLQEPLNTINNFVGLLQTRYANQLDQQGQTFLQFSSDAAIRMKTLVTALLNYSRLRRTSMTYHPINCEQLLAAVQTDLQDAIDRSAATVYHQNCTPFIGNEPLMRQLLQNLIANAIKFHRPNVPPEIHISMREESSHWLFTIQDNGIGIEEQYFEEIFGIFRRLHTQTTYEGTGLGLAMCRQIVELHSGTIWLSSQIGQGTTFYFTIYKIDTGMHGDE